MSDVSNGLKYRLRIPTPFPRAISSTPPVTKPQSKPVFSGSSQCFLGVPVGFPGDYAADASRKLSYTPFASNSHVYTTPYRG